MITESLVYFGEDDHLVQIANKQKKKIKVFPYHELTSCSADDSSLVVYENIAVTVHFFGHHNMQNLAGAMEICKLLGVSEKDFLVSMTSFRGAARRQELLAHKGNRWVYLDFAHAPSKVAATVEAFRYQYKEKRLIACLELHTYSSLNTAFLPQSKSSMDQADTAIVFYDPEVVKHKKLPVFTPEVVMEAFQRPDLIVLQDSSVFEKLLLNFPGEDTVFLIMTSGSFSGLNLKNLAEAIVSEE
jgi:UDP-N-acetylmuramate: L-alanyl-gamma-D-glutamyl-meso-diaminopimelate ligase